MKEAQSQILFRVTDSFVTRKLTYQVILERGRDSKKTDRDIEKETESSDISMRPCAIW